MTKSLLIVSADTKFAQVLLHGLEQEGYRVQITRGKGESVVRADEENSSLALLDMDLGYRAVLETGQALRMLNPDIRLVVFSREGVPPDLDELHPWLSSPKPYFLPDVLNMLNNNSTPPSQYSNPPPDREVQTSNSALPWLQDVTRAAQHLTRLTLESSAQAALITRGDSLWAYAGQLSQGAAKELAVAVTRHWDGQKGSDLLRFVRLEATKAEHMLYATRLADDVVLALVFDAETPFSTIRSQAGQLVNRLSTQTPEVAEPSVSQKPLPAAYDVPTEYVEDESSQDLDIPSIADILSDVPPPRPERGLGPIPSGEQEDFVPPVTPSRSKQYSRESSPAVRTNDLLVSNQESDQTVEPRVGGIEDIDATMPSKSRKRPETPIRRPMPGELDETRPHSITEVAGRVMLEPISPGLYNLTYACLLVPRFSSHYLTGDMADRISEWLPQICIAFGWRLEYMAVRPEYVQWVLNVPPATSPGYLMRIVRQQTSEKIFIEFPKLKRENPSGDFWAPGYLIMGGTQPHPPQLVKDYIKQTRTRQGYSQPRNNIPSR